MGKLPSVVIFTPDKYFAVLISTLKRNNLTVRLKNCVSKGKFVSRVISTSEVTHVFLLTKLNDRNIVYY